MSLFDLSIPRGRAEMMRALSLIECETTLFRNDLQTAFDPFTNNSRACKFREWSENSDVRNVDSNLGPAILKNSDCSWRERG